jgi:hypothetical protein
MELITKQQSKRQHVSTRDDSKSKDTCERKVTFDSVQVRFYSQTLGDNPSVSCGPPITLDWHYEEELPMDIAEHQGSRVITRGQPRRFCLNYYQRCNILTYYCGFTKTEIKRAERQVDKARSQRKITVFLSQAMIVEDFLGSAARKTKRVLVGASLNNHNRSATCTTTS